MRWINLLTLFSIPLILSCGRPTNLAQSSDLPSVSNIQIDNNSITLQGRFLNRVTRLRLLGKQTDTLLTLNTQSYDQIQAIPPTSLGVILGATYNLLISSAEADSNTTINFIINPGQITPTLLDRSYVPATGGTFSGNVAVSGQLSSTGTFYANTATLINANLGVTTVIAGQSGLNSNNTLTIGSATGVKGNLLVNGMVGTCTLGSATGAVSCTSDLRLKTEIHKIPQAMEKLKTLRGVYYKWKSSFKDDGKTHIGLIAQEVEKKFPELVTDLPTEQGSYRSVDYAGLVAPLIEAVKELDSQMSNLRSQLLAQQKETAALKDELRKLKKN